MESSSHEEKYMQCRMVVYDNKSIQEINLFNAYVYSNYIEQFNVSM